MTLYCVCRNFQQVPTFTHKLSRNLIHRLITAIWPETIVYTPNTKINSYTTICAEQQTEQNRID